ncbi:DUF1778 domain-containing protein [Chromatium okenii]|nr:DUF1778 domain-containing protein [Chromatium okenii]
MLYQASSMASINIENHPVNHSIRNTNINIRAQRCQRDLIDQAAELLGKTRSEFVLETACREAQEVLLDQRVLTLDTESFQAVQLLLDAPPSDNPKLRQLMTMTVPWET